MNNELLITKLSIIRQIIEPPDSDIKWGIHKLNSLIISLQNEMLNSKPPEDE